MTSVVLCKVSQPSRLKRKSYDGKLVTAKRSSINYGATLINSHSLMQTLNLSEVEDSLQLASDWINSVRKHVNKSKAVTLLGSLL